MREYDASSHIGRELLIHIATEGKCVQCGHWVPIKSKINSQISGTVLLFSHRQKYATGSCAAGLTSEVRRGVIDSQVPAWPVEISPAATRRAIEQMSEALRTPANVPAKMTGATNNMEDTRVDSQTQELRIRLRAARAERELKIKTDNADAIVTRLDSLPAGAIVRFVKPYAATGGKPAGEYTYVAIKPVDGARWYTTGCDANPMTSDDLASFMVGGDSVASWDVLSDTAAETFTVSAIDAPAETDTPKSDS